MEREGPVCPLQRPCSSGPLRCPRPYRIFDRELLTTPSEDRQSAPGTSQFKVLRGVEISTGSLGQGLSIANGMAMGLRMDGLDSGILSFGRRGAPGGQVWEAAMTAVHYRIDNICAIVDNNGLQIRWFLLRCDEDRAHQPRNGRPLDGMLWTSTDMPWSRS